MLSIVSLRYFSPFQTGITIEILGVVIVAYTIGDSCLLRQAGPRTFSKPAMPAESEEPTNEIRQGPQRLTETKSRKVCGQQIPVGTNQPSPDRRLLLLFLPRPVAVRESPFFGEKHQVLRLVRSPGRVLPKPHLPSSSSPGHPITSRTGDLPEDTITRSIHWANEASITGAHAYPIS